MGAAATGTPLLPTGYVAGTISISAAQAGSAQSLLALIQAQLDPNVQGAAQEVNISSDSSGIVYIGTAKNLAGTLSASNYGVALPASTTTFAPYRNYRATFPGINAPVGNLYVFMSSTGTFHVEVI